MRTWFWLAGAVVLARLLLWPAPAARVEEGVTVPGDARRGVLLFRKQRCIECHSFQGVGGTAAPDLGRRSAREYTPERLAAVMWNHAPAMWQTMVQKGIAIPALNQEEAADLYAYFYSVRYFERPGDAARGKAVFATKRCSQCHALRAGEPGGPAVSNWKAVSDPIAWAREMWNHSQVMLQQMQHARISWPNLTAQELVDLLVYLQNLPETRSAKAGFAPSDPREGRALFQQKGCGNCHSLGAEEAGKINLRRARQPAGGMIEFAAAMWNHAPQVHRRAQRTGGAIPTFTGTEMNHLVGYLFWVRFFEDRGDANRGRRVYVRKNCASCHDQKTASAAPDLAQFRGQVSPIFITAALWKHGPEMLPLMKQHGYPWPQFSGTDMADLIAYLNRKP